ncbi:XRE family transcriptional regulator [Flavobacterium sp. HSC-61S13]|uniref:XRE family transcriptional regulator n=1 Tax=Flavobacterium sp. HSC-61S13 TaxID=2910963 RepID=UPI0020A16417|nr:XRE family transcriptional regulator [Flavobacterium sp. HSC-61S13]MCP1996613.1 plasmid maintenance system antidote protein VapI [Flavobacterium sp. HSC-61S13]
MDTKSVVSQRFIDTVDSLILKGDVKSKASLSRDLGIKPNSLSEIIGGRMHVGIDIILRLCDLYSIDVEWQLTGRGEMFATKKESSQFEEANTVVITDDTLDDDKIEVVTNSNGNKFFLLPNGRIKMEVAKVPFPAYASYLEVYQDDQKLLDEFEKITFTVDHVGRGNYLGFRTAGDSMNGGGIDDTPDKADVLAREVGRHLWDGGFRKTKYGMILVTSTGIYHKDISGYCSETGTLELTSRNSLHKPIKYPINDVHQIFNVIKRMF